MCPAGCGALEEAGCEADGEGKRCSGSKPQAQSQKLPCHSPTCSLFTRKSGIVLLAYYRHSHRSQLHSSRDVLGLFCLIQAVVSISCGLPGRKMSGEDVTASTLSKDQDMKEAEVPAASKKAAADVAKLEQDIESAKSLAKSVQPVASIQRVLPATAQSISEQDLCLLLRASCRSHLKLCSIWRSSHAWQRTFHAPPGVVLLWWMFAMNLVTGSCSMRTSFCCQRGALNSSRCVLATCCILELTGASCMHVTLDLMPGSGQPG